MPHAFLNARFVGFITTAERAGEAGEAPSIARSPSCGRSSTADQSEAVVIRFDTPGVVASGIHDLTVVAVRGREPAI